MFVVLENTEEIPDYDMVYALKKILESQEIDQFNRGTFKELNQLYAKS